MVSIWNPETGILDLSPDEASISIQSLRQVEAEWGALRSQMEASGTLTTFTERLHREWAIETGIIEHLYDIERGVTQSLIEQGFITSLMVPGSVNRPPAHIKALLEDQQNALEGLFSFVKQDRPLSTGYIKELHQAMTRSQAEVTVLDPTGKEISVPLVSGDYKKHPNYPVRDGVAYHYCPPEQVASEMDRLVALHSEHRVQGIKPEVEAAWLHHRFTQIHPFQDGNGRVARALASLCLIRAGLFPMSVSRDERSSYIEHLEQADQGSLYPLTLFIARLQDEVRRRAAHLSTKLEPKSASLEEAIWKFTKTRQSDPTKGIDHIGTSVKEKHLWLMSRVEDRLSYFRDRQFKTAGLGGFMANHNPTADQVMRLRAGAKSRHPDAAMAALTVSEITLDFAPEYQLLIGSFPLSDEFGSLICTSAYWARDGQAAVELSPELTWRVESKQGEIEQLAVDWLPEMLIQIFDLSRESYG